ncbi:Na+/H+ antiporter subunit E [Nocardioides daphniae]|nr:Na+/H+ antiporter subunit E [Nocardioides daphniae]
MRTTRSGKLRPARYRAIQPWPMLWLVLFWVGLWGTWSPGIVLLGVVVAALASYAFPLPPVSIGARVRLLPLAWLVLHFLYDVVKASVLVSIVVLRRRPVRNAIVTVDLQSDSDFVLTAVGAMLTLVPGSIIVEARRSTHTLFLHVLDVDDVAGAEAFRQQALAVEERFLAAFEPIPEEAR